MWHGRCCCVFAAPTGAQPRLEMFTLHQLLTVSTLAASLFASTHVAHAAHLGPRSVEKAPTQISTSFDGASVKHVRGRNVRVKAWGNVQGACTKERRAAAAALARDAAQDLLSELGAPARRRTARVRFVDRFGDGFELRCEARVEVDSRR